MEKLTRIKPPKYKVGRNVLNEYEVRCLMSEVCLGQKPWGIKITDSDGLTAEILPDGRLTQNLKGLDLSGNYTLILLREERKRKNFLETRKSLDYYLNLKYDIIIHKSIEDEDGIEFMAYSEELGKFSCYGIGKTQEEALSSFLVEKEDFINMLYENEKFIPEPKKED